MKAPTDIDVLNRFKDDYNNIKSGNNETIQRYDYSINVVNYELLKLLNKKRAILDEKERYIRHVWYNYSLLKRIIDKFKVKYIYRSKKARDYYLKFVNKVFKFKNPNLDFGYDEFERLLKLKSDSYKINQDEEKAKAYDIVLKDLFNQEDMFNGYY